MGNNYTMVAKTLFGFEDILAAELQQLGAINVRKGTRSVFFEGDNGFMYKANIALRTAIKILKPIKTFTAANEKALYTQIYEMSWEKYMTDDTTFAIDAVLATTVFNHSQYVALKAKDAIVDKFRNTKGRRPNVDIRYPDLRIHVHVQETRITISLDSSGHSLHQRGYRSATNNAPINEVLAAGILLQSGWKGQCDFLDPMCGSGTIVVEAAMIACNIPPNINRKEFAFEKWLDFDASLFDKITAYSLEKVKAFHHNIYGYDKALSAVRKATDNVKNANLNDYIFIKHQDFFTSEKPTDHHLHMVFNPPYGVRSAIATEAFYKAIGDTFKQHYPTTEAWFITSNMEGLKYVGLRSSRKIKLFNGMLESRLVKYEIYAGSKRLKFNTNRT